MNGKFYSISDKILHIKATFQNSHRNYYTFLPGVEMDFFIRKIFREREIQYSYSRKHKRITVNNPDGHPFRLWFQFTDSDYIRVSTIPMADYELLILAKDPADFFRKLVDKRVITVRQWKKLVPTQKYEKRMRQWAINYWKRELNDCE